MSRSFHGLTNFVGRLIGRDDTYVIRLGRELIVAGLVEKNRSRRHPIPATAEDAAKLLIALGGASNSRATVPAVRSFAPLECVETHKQTGIPLKQTFLAALTDLIQRQRPGHSGSRRNKGPRGRKR